MCSVLSLYSSLRQSTLIHPKNNRNIESYSCSHFLFKHICAVHIDAVIIPRETPNVVQFSTSSSDASLGDSTDYLKYFLRFIFIYRNVHLNTVHSQGIVRSYVRNNLTLR